VIYKIRFRPQAEADLIALDDFIADKSGMAVARAYLDRIEAACLALETFPRRGSSRDDILPGLRLVGFERRAVIAFRIKAAQVLILRIFYGGRDVERLLPGRHS
jgi:toxin ParE1/3/4